MLGVCHTLSCLVTYIYTAKVFNSFSKNTKILRA
jgi:hypothetical protein